MEKISVKYKDCIEEMMRRMRPDWRVDKDNVYQAANLDIRPFVDRIISEQLASESALHGFENLEALFEKARAGASCWTRRASRAIRSHRTRRARGGYSRRTQCRAGVGCCAHDGRR